MGAHRKGSIEITDSTSILKISKLRKLIEMLTEFKLFCLYGSNSSCSSVE